MGGGVPGTPGDKGKGKEVDGGMEAPGQDVGMGGGDGEGDDDDGKGEKRRKNSYKHLIKGLPGASYHYNITPSLDPSIVACVAEWPVCTSVLIILLLRHQASTR
jgi:hypothetical protein